MAEPIVFQARVGGSGLTHTARRVAAAHLDAGRPIDGIVMEPVVLCSAGGQQVIGYDTLRIATGRTDEALRIEGHAVSTLDASRRLVAGKPARVNDPKLTRNIKEATQALAANPETAGIIDEFGDAFVPEGSQRNTQRHKALIPLMETLGDGRPAFIFIGAGNIQSVALVNALQAVNLPLLKTNRKFHPLYNASSSELFANLVGPKGR